MPRRSDRSRSVCASRARPWPRGRALAVADAPDRRGAGRQTRCAAGHGHHRRLRATRCCGDQLCGDQGEMVACRSPTATICPWSTEGCGVRARHHEPARPAAALVAGARGDRRDRDLSRAPAAHVPFVLITCSNTPLGGRTGGRTGSNSARPFGGAARTGLAAVVSRGRARSPRDGCDRHPPGRRVRAPGSGADSVRGHGGRLGFTTDLWGCAGGRSRRGGTPVHDETVAAGCPRHYPVVRSRARLFPGTVAVQDHVPLRPTRSRPP
jgi:hypothetical protein